MVMSRKIGNIATQNNNRGLSIPLNLSSMMKEFDPKAIAKTIDVEELYDLDITIAKFILPRLIAFKQHSEGQPRLNMKSSTR